MNFGKAHAAAGGIGLGAAIVTVLLWWFNLDPPQAVVIAMQTIVSAALTIPAVYFTPHKQTSGASNV